MMRALIVFCVVTGVLLASQPAHAIGPGGDGGGNLGGDGSIDVGVTVTTPGVDSPVDVNGSTATQPIVWTVVDDGPASSGDLSHLCLAGPFDPEHPAFGWMYHLIGRALDGTLVPDKLVCVPFTNPAQQPPPPPPPVLPTIEEVWRHANLPTPVIGLDPATRGITGLDTRIWTESGTTLGISATLDGYAITGTATVIGYLVQVDDEPPIRATTGGSASSPIAHHIFETKGTHSVRIGVLWHGVATFSGPDLASPVTISIGDATITATRSYTVNEIRSVLQP